MSLLRSDLTELKPYVPGKPAEELQRELGLERVVKLASNENPFGVSPAVEEAIRNVIPELARYPDGGAYLLRERLADFWNVESDQIILGNGSDEVILMLALTFLEPGDQVVISEHAFIRYKMAAMVAGAVPVEVPMKDLTHDVSAMVERITPKTKFFCVVNPNNPTGTIVKKQAMEEALEAIPEEVLVVIDEAYYEYIDDEAYPQTLPWLSRRRNLIILRTFSKVYGLAGLRVGYGLSHSDIVRDLNRVRPPFNITTPAQVAAVAALDDQDHVRESREKNRSGLHYLEGELKRLKLPVTPTWGNFVLFEVSVPAATMFDRLLHKGVIVRPQAGHGLPNHVRVTSGTSEENRIFIQALEDVLLELGQHPSPPPGN